MESSRCDSRQAQWAGAGQDPDEGAKSQRVQDVVLGIHIFGTVKDWILGEFYSIFSKNIY